MIHRVVATCATLGLLVSVAQYGNAQGAGSSAIPGQVTLSEVEIGLELRRGGGGCPGRCAGYRTVIAGTGDVTFEDLGGEPRGPRQQRTIAIDQVVLLLNEFLAASFLDRPAGYSGLREVRRVGDSLEILRHVAIDAPTWILSLRLGPQRKEVRLYWEYPAELGRLRDRVAEIGGPEAWKK